MPTKPERFLPDVITLDDMLALAKFCPFCGAFAVVPLTERQFLEQPDFTSHVCHPSIGGCNQGFGIPDKEDA